MVKFLTQVLGPIFTGLGVSEADLKSYITQLQGYIYVILAALVVMIVVLFAASKAKKDSGISSGGRQFWHLLQ